MTEADKNRKVTKEEYDALSVGDVIRNNHGDTCVVVTRQLEQVVFKHKPTYSSGDNDEYTKPNLLLADSWEDFNEFKFQNGGIAAIDQGGIGGA